MISCNGTQYFMDYRTNNEKLQKPRTFIKIIRGKVKEGKISHCQQYTEAERTKKIGNELKA